MSEENGPEEILTEETLPEEINWAAASVERDMLRMRLDIYEENLVLKSYGQDANWTRRVDADRIAAAFMQHMGASTGLLPRGALWWKQSEEGVVTALWREPRVWTASLQVEAFQPPERFRLPMPGLLFITAPGRAPWIFATLKRPEDPEETLCNAPTFNVFRNGRVCPGSHRFPDRADEVPESFFQSRFSMTGDTRWSCTGCGRRSMAEKISPGGPCGILHGRGGNVPPRKRPRTVLNPDRPWDTWRNTRGG